MEKSLNALKLDLNDNRISEATCEHVSSIFSVGKSDGIEIVLDEQDEESDYETDGDDIDLESISKIVAETYSPKSFSTELYSDDIDDKFTVHLGTAT